MNRDVAAYAGTAAVMVALDLLWLGVIAKPLYQQGIAHLMTACCFDFRILPSCAAPIGLCGH